MSRGSEVTSNRIPIDRVRIDRAMSVLKRFAGQDLAEQTLRKAKSGQAALQLVEREAERSNGGPTAGELGLGRSELSPGQDPR